MRYQQDLQVALRDRLRRLISAHPNDYFDLIDRTTTWLKTQPSLTALLTVAERAEPDLDFDGWLAGIHNRAFSWPSKTEDGQAALIWKFLNHFETLDGPAAQQISFTFTSSRSEIARTMTERLLAPLIDYLSERVGTEGTILYLLDRYVRKVEWFERDTLYGLYQQDTARGEAIYDTDLRKFLFMEGVNMPFSQLKSPSGLSDVLADLDGDDPLICELKLFCSDKRSIVSGLHQAVHYAQDHSKTAAFLVIINLSGRPLDLPSDGPADVQPRYLDLSGVRVYLVPVRALPQESASKLGKASPVVLPRDDLINPDIN